MNRITAVLSAFILAVGFAAVTAIPAHATEDTTEVVWLLPETVTELPVGNTPAIWPQTYLPEGVVPCGRFGQADVYPTTEVADLIEDGILERGEDYAVVVSWRFIDGGVCPELTTAVVTVTDATCDAVAVVSLTGEHVTWRVVSDQETAAGPAGTVVEPVPSGIYPALMNGGEPQSETNLPVYGSTVFTAVADNGYAVVLEPVTVVTVEPDCALVPPPLPVVPALAATGVNELTGPLGLVAFVLLVLGGSILAVRRAVRS